MKKLAPILLLALVVLLMAGSASAKPRAGCVVEFRVFRGLHAQVGGLRVFVDSDQAWTETTEDAANVFTFDVNPGWMHVINVLQPGHGLIWSADLTCVNPAVIPLAAFISGPVDW